MEKVIYWLIRILRDRRREPCTFVVIHYPDDERAMKELEGLPTGRLPTRIMHGGEVLGKRGECW